MDAEHQVNFSFAPPRFGLGLPEAIDTYFDVLTGTSVKLHIQQAMLPLWLEGYTRGDPRLEEAAFGPLLIEGISFKWPWFDEWRAKFKAAKSWPYSWAEFADKAADGRLGLRAERARMLARTISSRCYNRHQAINHTANSVLARKGWKVTNYDEEQSPWLAEMAEKIVLGDYKTYPPFFPGDLASVDYDPTFSQK